MISISETVNGSITSGNSIVVDFGSVGVNLDASEYSSIAYWVSCPDYESLALTVGDSTWVIDVNLSSEITNGNIPLPVGRTWAETGLVLTNNSGVTVSGVNFIVGISKETVATGNAASVAPMITSLSRDLVYTTSINNQYPLSLRSSNDASLMVSTMIPSDVATLNGFTPVATINGFTNKTWGNVAPTTASLNRRLNLAAVTGPQHIIIVPNMPPAYPPLSVEYIVDVDTVGECQVKFGSLEFDVTQTAISLGLLRPQSYHLFTVTSLSGIAGTLSVTVNGVTVTSAVGAASNRVQQAANIAIAINNNPVCLARAIAFVDRVYVRTLINSTTGTMSVNNLYTVTSTSLVSNAGFSDTSVPLSTRVLAARRDPLETPYSSYRFWVRPDMVSCYRRSPTDFSSWTFIGSHSLMSSSIGGDGDLVVFNSTSYGTTNAKTLNSVSMYAKNSMKKVIDTYSVSRNIPSWGVYTLLGFMVPSSTTGIVLRSLTVENTTGNPALIQILINGTIPSSNSIFGTNVGKLVCTDVIATTVIGGFPLYSYLFPSGVTQFQLDTPIAPNTLHTITIENDPVASTKSGRVGVIAVFDEVI
jgi:hypothetical protein